MVDNMNPTSQFHPYTPVDVTPVAERPAPVGLGGVLSRFGINTKVLDGAGGNVNGAALKQSLNKVRELARRNPALTLGGLALAAIGAGLLRRR